MFRCFSVSVHVSIALTVCICFILCACQSAYAPLCHCLSVSMYRCVFVCVCFDLPSDSLRASVSEPHVSCKCFSVRVCSIRCLKGFVCGYPVMYPCIPGSNSMTICLYVRLPVCVCAHVPASVALFQYLFISVSSHR